MIYLTLMSLCFIYYPSKFKYYTIVCQKHMAQNSLKVVSLKRRHLEQQVNNDLFGGKGKIKILTEHLKNMQFHVSSLFLFHSSDSNASNNPRINQNRTLSRD